MRLLDHRKKHHYYQSYSNNIDKKKKVFNSTKIHYWQNQEQIKQKLNRNPYLYTKLGQNICFVIKVKMGVNQMKMNILLSKGERFNGI